MYLNVISLRRRGSEGRVETVPTSPTFYFAIWKLQKKPCKAHIILPLPVYLFYNMVI